VGTATTAYPLTGEIVSIRMGNAGSAVTAGGSADFTFTRLSDGGTVLAVTNVSAPWQYQPREPAHTTTGGTTAYSSGVGPVLTDGVPIADYLVCTIAQGGPSASGTVYIYYER
jgi:hypothetical protein